MSAQLVGARRLLRSPRALEAARFLAVGGTAFVIDTGLFNLLVLLGRDGITAKVASSVVAIGFAYLGSRYFTFRTADRHGVPRQAAMFVGANVAGAGVAVLCLWCSQTVLGLSGPVADNVAANIVGVGLGTLVRYVLYRFAVFRPGRRPA